MPPARISDRAIPDIDSQPLNIYNRVMPSLFQALVVLALITFLPIAVAADNFSFLGTQLPLLRLPAPDTTRLVNWWDSGAVGVAFWADSSTRIPGIPFLLEKELRLHISDKGEVDSISLPIPADSHLVRGLLPSLKNLRFEPARRDNHEIPFILPTILLLSERLKQPHASLQLPIYPPHQFKSRELIEKALRLNGMSRPQLKRFPPYFCAYKLGEKVDRYPFAVFQVDLDSAARLENIFEYCSTDDRFSGPVSKAIMYAEFAPARYDNTPFPASIYLVFRFFDRLKYPTDPWPPLSESSGDLIHDQMRIEPRLYLDSLINPPMPLNVPNGIFLADSTAPGVDTIAAYITIDTLGRATADIFSHRLWDRPVAYCRDILNKLRFSPARNLGDFKLPFHGRLIFFLNDSKTIRIHPCWLDFMEMPSSL